MTRIMVAIVLSAFVPAFAGDAIHTDAPGTAAVQSSRAAAVRGKLAERRARRKAKLEAMTPEEREAWKAEREAWKAERERQRKESIEKRRQEIAARLEAAKAACPDCYRVVQTETGYVGMTKAQYESYQADKKAKAERMKARKLGKRPARLRRQRPRPSGKTRIRINGME